MVKVGILPRSHFYSLFPLVTIKTLFCSQPLIFELLIESIYFWSQSFGIDIFAFDQFYKLVFGNDDISLSVRAKQEYLLQIFRNDVATLY